MANIIAIITEATSGMRTLLVESKRDQNMSVI